MFILKSIKGISPKLYILQHRINMQDLNTQINSAAAKKLYEIGTLDPANDHTSPPS